MIQIHLGFQPAQDTLTKDFQLQTATKLPIIMPTAPCSVGNDFIRSRALEAS